MCWICFAQCKWQMFITDVMNRTCFAFKTMHSVHSRYSSYANDQCSALFDNSGRGFLSSANSCRFFTSSRHHWSVRMELLRCCWNLLYASSLVSCVLGDTDSVYCARVRCFVLEESRKEVLVLRFACKHLWNCFYNSSRVGASVHV